MSFIADIQQRFKKGTIVEKLIYINLGVFVLAFLFNTFGFLIKYHGNFVTDWFILPATFEGFITKPWTLISYGFVHTEFLHILFNLIALYFIGNLFIQYFTQRQLLSFYILGTLFGGLIFLLSYNYFPAFTDALDRSYLLGASAGISAIFVGIATYTPNYQFKLPLIGYVKLWHLAAIWVVLDFIQIPGNNSGGHLAHIGGAIFGFLYVRQASNKKINIFDQLSNLFRTKKKPLRTVYKSKKASSKTNSKSTKADYQKKVDAILEKISKSGYDTLSPEEKAFLFKQGKK